MVKPHRPYDGPVVTREQARQYGLTRFFTGKPCKHGHLSQRTTANGGCIQCNAITTKALYQQEAPEKRQRRLETTVAWRAKFREDCLAYGRDYARAHKAEQRARQIANRELLNAQAREARLRNPELFKARAARFGKTPKGKLSRAVDAQRRRARLLGAEGVYTRDDVLRIGERQKWKCHWCGIPTKKKYHADHLISLAKGGTNWPSNIVISCPTCNWNKNDLDPIDFARRIGRLL
jgi:hypothetical protein